MCKYRHDDDIDTASPFRPVRGSWLNRSDKHLMPGGKLQLPPLNNEAPNRLRPSSSYGDLGEAEKQKEKKRQLKKSNAIIIEPSSTENLKPKEFRSLSIAVPPNSFESVSHIVSPLPTRKQFIHTDSIQRYDDEVMCMCNETVVMMIPSPTGGISA